MGMSQWYVGTPNGVVVCVEQLRGGCFCGEIYHSYSKEAAMFSNIDELVFMMDKVYEELCYPFPTTETRTFGKEEQTKRDSGQEKTKVMEDEELLSRHGDLGTFMIRVQHRQNSSWQGRITWMEENKTVYFRSIWEMVKLIASAVETVEGASTDEGEEETTWFDRAEEGEQIKAKTEEKQKGPKTAKKEENEKK